MSVYKIFTMKIAVLVVQFFVKNPMKSLMREKWETYCEISGHFRQLRGADARNWNHYLPSPLRAAGLGPAHDAATPWSGTTQHRRFDQSATQVPRQERCPPDEPCSSEHDRDADELCPARRCSKELHGDVGSRRRAGPLCRHQVTRPRLMSLMA